jgi:hypothetical protein
MKQLRNQSFFFIVEIPKGRYNGQKLMKLVATKTIASTPRIIAVVPLIIFRAYKTPTIAASTILKTRSTDPMFFFITLGLGIYLK